VIAVVVSRADRASEHIGEHLLDCAAWRTHEDDTRPPADGGGTVRRTEGFELRTFDDLHIDLDDPSAAFDDPDLLVVVSRHAGETGALLTAHHTGNFGPADYGGEPGRFARAAPGAQQAALAALDEHAPPAYDVGIECTHHGPTAVDVPSLFVELGSGEAEWDDPAGARAVARAVLDLKQVDPTPTRTVVGFGGGHYAPRYERVCRETGWAVGHVGADWALDAMGDPAANRAVVERAFARSGADRALVEGDRPALEATVEALGHRVVSETWLREADGVPLALVERLEATLTTVEDGLRFGRPAAGAPADAAVTVRDLPADLLDAAAGVDADATREAVAATACAFETTEGGTRPRGRAAFHRPDGSEGGDGGQGDRDPYDALVDALVEVLAREYETVERRDGVVVARTEQFDPALARRRGVTEGPAFGRLAGGEPVEVDGRRVTPAEVHAERVDRFPT
jgi:D-aminoacyl-tRNA deacylase